MVLANLLVATTSIASAEFIRTPANSPDVRLHGRPSNVPGTLPILGWSGAGATIRFSGTSCSVALRSTEAWWSLEVDGQELAPFSSHESTSDSIYPLVSGLPPGDHVLTLRKRTEAQYNRARLNAFLTDGPVLPAVPSSPRRIQFIGNSLACGYGILDSVGTNSFSLETQDYFSTFASRTARAFGADDHAICWSGRGVVRNYNLTEVGTMPSLWELADPNLPNSKWDHSQWTPQVVVIDLGTNDYFQAPPPDSAAFEDTFFRFLRRIRSVHPGVPLVLADGPMLTDTAPVLENGAPFPTKTRLRAHMRSLCNRMADSGESGVVPFSFTPMEAGIGFGADFHPNSKQHARSGEELIRFLQGLMGWETLDASVRAVPKIHPKPSNLRVDGDGWRWEDASPTTRWRVIDPSGAVLAQGQGARIPRRQVSPRGWRWAVRSDLPGVWTLR